MDDNFMSIPKIPRFSTQKGKVLTNLLRCNHVSNMGLVPTIDSLASASRISELRTDGWPIEDVYVYELGKKVRTKRYYIRTKNLINYLKSQKVKDFLSQSEMPYKKAS